MSWGGSPTHCVGFKRTFRRFINKNKGISRIHYKFIFELRGEVPGENKTVDKGAICNFKSATGGVHVQFDGLFLE
jgi:hypothetical protein